MSESVTTEGNAEAEVEEVEELPKCKKCGTTREDKYSSCEREYSFLGSLYLIWGGTSVPTKLKFRCLQCGHVFEESQALWLRRQYVK